MAARLSHRSARATLAQLLAEPVAESERPEAEADGVAHFKTPMPALVLPDSHIQSLARLLPTVLAVAVGSGEPALSALAGEAMQVMAD